MSRQQQVSGASGPGMIVGGGGDGSYVSAEMLKQVDTPIETLLGATNGALSGALLAGGVSSALSYVSDKHETLGKTIISNAKGAHKWPIIAATVVLGAIGGLVRYSRASKHNEWSERHYSFLEQQQSGFASRVQGQEENNKEGHSR